MSKQVGGQISLLTLYCLFVVLLNASGGGGGYFCEYIDNMEVILVHLDCTE